VSKAKNFMFVALYHFLLQLLYQMLLRLSFVAGPPIS